MTTKVITALQSGDPEQYAALGREFITPEIDKKRAELAAKKKKKPRSRQNSPPLHNPL